VDVHVLEQPERSRRVSFSFSETQLLSRLLAPTWELVASSSNEPFCSGTSYTHLSLVFGHVAPKRKISKSEGTKEEVCSVSTLHVEFSLPRNLAVVGEDGAPSPCTSKFSLVSSKFTILPLINL